MSEFRIRPIDESLAQRVRESLKDPIYGLSVHVEPATGYGPCRLCLRTFAPGEPRILFLYNAFSAEQEADLAGPVFIHAGPCAPYGEPSVFPEDVANLPIVLRGYDRHRRCIAEIVPAAGAAAAILESMFESASVDVVHVRNTEAKCFIARVERSRKTLDQPKVLVSSR
jgi:uncharacterized protein DUF1203